MNEPSLVRSASHTPWRSAASSKQRWPQALGTDIESAYGDPADVCGQQIKLTELQAVLEGKETQGGDPAARGLVGHCHRQLQIAPVMGALADNKQVLAEASLPTTARDGRLDRGAGRLGGSGEEGEKDQGEYFGHERPQRRNRRHYSA